MCVCVCERERERLERLNKICLCLCLQILESSQTLLHVLKRETNAAGGAAGSGSVSTRKTVPHTTQ